MKAVVGTARSSRESDKELGPRIQCPAEVTCLVAKIDRRGGEPIAPPKKRHTATVVGAVGFTLLVVAVLASFTRVDETSFGQLNQAPITLDLVSRGPIAIDGDADFSAKASSEGWSGDGTKVSPFVISNYSIESGTRGISIVNTTVYFVLSNCSLRYYLTAGIYLENVTNGYLVQNNCTSIDSNGGIFVLKVVNTTIAHNKCSALSSMGSTGEGIDVYFSEKMTIYGNNCSGGQPLGLYYVNDSIVANNSFYQGKYNCALVQYSRDNTITNNSFGGGIQPGVRLVFSPANYFDNNTFEGLWLENSDDCIIANNNFNGQGAQPGLGLLSSDHVVVRGNLWNGTGGPALGTGVLFTTSNYCLFYENNYSRCFSAAVYIPDTSGNNTFWNNTFYYNRGSGDTYDPAKAQAWDASSYNRWNSSEGYGNYWTDLQSPDVVIPFGIVDVPYEIVGGAGAQDYYPRTFTTTVIPEFDSALFVPLFILGAFMLTARYCKKR